MTGLTKLYNALFIVFDFIIIHVKEHFASQYLGLLVYSLWIFFKIGKMSKSCKCSQMGWAYVVMGETHITASRARIAPPVVIREKLPEPVYGLKSLCEPLCLRKHNAVHHIGCPPFSPKARQSEGPLVRRPVSPKARQSEN